MLFFWTFYSSKNPKAANQHIRMISDRSSDQIGEMDAWKFSFAITGINCILKYIKNRKQL